MRKKLKKSFIPLMIFLVLIVSIGAISAADAENIDEIVLEETDTALESSSDENILSADGDGTFTDLNNNLTGQTEVTLESDYTYSDDTDSAYANGITVDSELTINGNGKTLNPNGNLLFKIGTGGTLTLNDMTIVNSYTKTDAMIQNSGKLILNNVKFTVERFIPATTGTYKTIENNGEMTVANSTFKDSYIHMESNPNSRAMYIYGIIYNTQKITIENTIFDNNKMFNPANEPFGRTLDICALLHNTNEMLLNNVVIQNTNVSYVPYSTPHFEGIVFNEKGNLQINSSIIKDNTVYFPENENSNMMGVIYNEATNANLIISNSIIVDNSHMQKTAQKEIIRNKGVATLNDNYWGSNNPNFSKLINGGTAPTNFVVLGFEPETVTTGETKTFEITLNTVNSSGAISNLETGTLPNYNLTVSSKKLGETTVEIRNGVGQYNYLPVTAGEDIITINGEEYTITVNAAPAGTFTDLNNTIAANDEVNLYSNYTYDSSSDSALQTGIPINKEVTINGNGYTINSTALSGLFNIGTNGKLTLKNIVLVADYASATGNIINEGTLSLEKVTLSSSKTSANTELGAVIANKGTLSIQESEMIDSTINSQADNAVIYGLIYNEGNATIEQTLINNNKIKSTSTSTTKGLIYNKGKLIFNDNIVNNTESNVIYTDDENSETNIDNCNFENTAVTQAVYIASGSTTVSNSKFTNNNGAIYSKGTLTATKNIFKNNNANEGGAIYSTGSADIQNSIFEGNTATTGQAIYSTGTLNANNNYWATNTPNFETLIEGTSPQNYAIITIEGESNLIPESQAIYTVNFKTNDTNTLVELPDYTVDLSAANTLSDANVTIKKGTASFTYTAALNDGNDIIKAIVDNDERATFDVSIAEDPTAKGTFKELDRFIRKSDSEFNLTKDYTFDNDTNAGFENGITIDKEITINGHGFKINSTDLAKLFNVASGGKLTLNDVVLLTDYAKSGSSTNIYTEASFKNVGEVSLNNVTFTTHQEVSDGSTAFTQPIYNTGTLNIRNSKFIDSTINTNTQYCYGLIYNNQGNVIIENTIFDKNSMICTSTKSSSYLAGLIHNQGTLTLNNVNMTNNYMKTPNNIRGLIRGYTNNKLTVDRSIFENNTVESDSNNAPGTVMYLEGGSATISNSKFINNVGGRSGGAVYSTIGTTFINNTFERNNASDMGGAIYSTSSSIYINNTFKDNTAQSGGAIYSSATLQSGKSYLFTGNIFIGNNATKFGGAIYGATIGGSSLPIDNNTFINNYALEKGGAIYSSNAVRVKNSLFEGNTAGEGAVLYINGNYAATFSYSIFDENEITSTTGGLFYASSSSTYEYNYWGTNAPVFSDLIKVRSGTLTEPTNFAVITIEGDKIISENATYTVNFKNNATGDIIELQDYAVNLTTVLNTITPASVVITKGTANFTYNAKNFGEDTIKAMKNNAEKASLEITVESKIQTPEFTIVAEDVNYGNPLNLTFTLINGPTGENLYKWTIFSKSGLQLETGNITADNKIITTIKNAGNYTIKVALTDVEGWSDLTVNDTFEIKQANTEIKANITVNDDDTATIRFNITSNDQLIDVEGNISFEIDTLYQGNVEHGQTSITTNVLSPNTYTATVAYSGDANYASSTTNIKFTVDAKEEVNDNGTFTELNRLINGSHIIDLEHDHTFNETIDSELANGIIIDKEVTINGYGFTINSTSLSKLFNVASGGKLTLNDVVLATDYVATGTYTSARPLASFANAGEVTLNNVTFTTNLNVESTDTTLAASIYNAGTLNIENSKFVDSTINTNTGYCFGLIDNNGGNLNIKNTIFDKNSMIDNSTGSNVYANGLIYNMGTLTLINVNMTNNYMKTPYASRGLIRGYSDSSQITIDNSIFENNALEYTGTYAQGTVIYADSGLMEISNSKFINNSGAKLGGAIYSSTNTTFINNTFERNSAVNSGGAIYITSKETKFINNLFKDNKAGENGGAIYTSNSIQSEPKYTFTENIFIGNNATKNGGSVYVASIGSNKNPIENNIFINNFAVEKGGAIYSTGTLKITKTIFSKNSAGDGAIAYTTGTSSSTITYSLFDGNVITSPTGGLLRYASSSTANYNYWGTNAPNFDEWIKVASGTTIQPTNIIIIDIEGNETLYESDIYTVNFKDNVTGDIVELFNYTVDLTADLNTVTPASVVISEGIATFTYNAENQGTDTIRVMKNNVEIASFSITVSSPKQTPEFTIVANDVNYNESLDFTFNLTAGPAGENIYKWTIFSKNGLLLETGNVTSDNKIITKNTYNAGNYTIQVALTNVEGWNDLTVNDTFEIKALQSEIKPSVTVNDEDTVTIGINITSNNQTINVEGTISFEIDTVYEKTVENGQTTITTNKLTPGNYTITIGYTGDVNYAASTKEIKFTIRQAVVTDDVLNITKSDDNKTYNYTIKLPQHAAGNFTISVGNKTVSKELENGEATIILDGLNPGEQEVTITYTGDDNYKPFTKIDTINVPEEPKQTPEFNIVANDVYYGDALNITFTVTVGPTGENLYKWTIFSKNGLLLETGNVTSDNKIITKNTYNAGNYTIQVALTNVEGWNDLTVNDTFEIKNVVDNRSEISDDEINVSMSIPEGTTNPVFSINLPENATGNFTVYVDGTPYEKPLVNGSTVIAIENLTVGDHNISTAYSGDDNYKGFTTANKTVNIPKATLPGGETALNPTTPEGSDSPSYSINLPKDATGNLTVTVDGVNHTQELKNGSATVTVPKLTPGTHNITVTYTGDGKYANISKNSAYKVSEPVVKISNNKDITMLYTAKTPYKVLITVDGKAVVGEKVTFKYNGKTYYANTDKDGYATLKLPDVKPKKTKYTITAEYKGVKVSNKVKVNSIVKAKNLKVKKSKKVNKIKVTLKKVNGKFLKGKKLTLKIKGKKIKAKTNKKGVATFKVKKNVLKKLKVGKKYKYTVTFGKDTVTKKLTIKK